MATLYKGFSTYNRAKKFRVIDHELIKQDLFNHFNIRKGEKLMQPNFGSIVWNCLFEPLTDSLKNLIVEDVKRVVSYDPRTSVSNVIITEFDRGLQLEIELTYNNSNQVDSLKLMFDKNALTLTRG